MAVPPGGCAERTRKCREGAAARLRWRDRGRRLAPRMAGRAGGGGAGPAGRRRRTGTRDAGRGRGGGARRVWAVGRRDEPATGPDRAGPSAVLDAVRGGGLAGGRPGSGRRAGHRAVPPAGPAAPRLVPAAGGTAAAGRDGRAGDRAGDREQHPLRRGAPGVPRRRRARRAVRGAAVQRRGGGPQAEPGPDPPGGGGAGGDRRGRLVRRGHLVARRAVRPARRGRPDGAYALVAHGHRPRASPSGARPGGGRPGRAVRPATVTSWGAGRRRAAGGGSRWTRSGCPAGSAGSPSGMGRTRWPPCPAGGADIAARVLLPAVDRLSALVTGGDRRTVEAILADARLAPLAPLRVDRFLAVAEPRLATLEGAVRQARAVRIRLVEPATASA